MAQSNKAYSRLIGLTREASLIGAISGVLQWDQETHMPKGAADYRAEQVSYLAALEHERCTTPEIGELLAELEGGEIAENPESEAAANIREIRRGYDRATKLPTGLVAELARVTTQAHEVWADARSKSDFGLFRPWLEKIVSLKRRQAECYGYEECLYDALLDGFEPGEKASNLKRVFAGLREELVALLGRIVDSPSKPDRSILERRYPVDRQRLFNRMVAAAMGFDFRRGRIDTVVHPFCTTLGPSDVRLTTRYNETFVPESLFGVIHEMGHGLYEQGLSPEHFGTPMGASVSLGIHESQSRLWENFIGRGLPFWKHFYPSFQGLFSESLADVPLAEFHRAINTVEPSLIRVEADEVTYNLHIILRFELEEPLLRGDLQPADLPDEWNRRFRDLLGIEVPDDRRGCLQDVHWSRGSIGYFPTYALGNLYAAQFHAQAEADIGDLPGRIEAGDFAPLLHWLRDRIHRHGMRYPAPELVRRVTGSPLSSRPLIEHLRAKFDAVYGG